MNLLTKVLTRFYYSHSTALQGVGVGMVWVRKFHQNWTKEKLTHGRTDTRMHARRTQDHDISPTGLWQIKLLTKIDIIGANLLTKFHEDRKINVASRPYKEKCPGPRGGYVFQPTGIILKLVKDIIGMNLLTEFHEDRTVNVVSRVLTRFYYSHIRKNALPLGSHVFQANIIIFKRFQDIIETNLLTKFHDDWTISEASRVLTRKNATPPGGHVFQANVTIFELIQDNIETNLLTKFHEDWTINVPSRELTRQMLTPDNGQRTKGNHKSSP
ncbi:hypothetical protein DPMN_011831 [Dreissena polymorpha]|uniref:Uncharacterized protein n=1 Tax=Dreissena polymorpha TaxID=45954 RepID=A0A9D4N5V8_DREPO|nr:hypothetical protein DPMN_011831 [Dreissena polymorpha]